MSNKLIPNADPRLGLPSASSFERYFACPGAFLLSRGVPPDEIKRSEDAEAGSRIHAAREAGDVSALDMDEADLVADMALEEEAIFHKWCDDYQITDAEIVQERRVWLMEGKRRLCSAQIDFYALSRTKQMALILDRKSGRKGVQPPTRNWQLKGALVILASNFSLVGGRVAIVQPRVRRQNPCDYTPDDIYGVGGAWDQLNDLLVKVQDPTAHRVPGAHCDYCPAKGDCPEAKALVGSIAALAGLSWGTLPPETKLQLWEKCKTAQPIIDQLMWLLKKDVKAGRIPELTMTPDTHPRELTTATEVMHRLMQNFASSDPDLIPHVDEMMSVSVGALEEYIRTQKGGSKAAAQKWVVSIFGDLIKTKVREGYVVRKKPQAKLEDKA